MPPRRLRLVPSPCLAGAVACAALWTVCGTAPLAGQAVPARDLWGVPLGAVLEPAALAGGAGAAVWNPAAVGLQPAERLRLSVAALATGAAQGIEGQSLAAAVRRASGTTVSVSLARTAVAGLVRTDTDPQALGDIPYASLLGSLGVARDLLPHVTGGVAVRWREGRADQEVRQAIAADVGVVARVPRARDTRLAFSSFLWRPGREVEDRPALVAAADVRLAGASRAREARLGYTESAVNRGARERGPFVSGRWDRVEARAALVRATAGAGAATRVRSGLALYYARYAVGVAREEGIAGLGPVYQFTLSSLLK